MKFSSGVKNNSVPKVENSFLSNVRISSADTFHFKERENKLVTHPSFIFRYLGGGLILTAVVMMIINNIQSFEVNMGGLYLLAALTFLTVTVYKIYRSGARKVVFDKDRGIFKIKYKKYDTYNGRIDDICAVQNLYTNKIDLNVRSGNPGTSLLNTIPKFVSECNLVLYNGTRVHVFLTRDVKKVTNNAEMLAAYLSVPLWSTDAIKYSSVDRKVKSGE